MNRYDKAREIARREAIAAEWNASAKVLRDEMDADARREWQENGSGTTWTFKDLGRVTLPLSNETPYVSDIAALLKWCKERFPQHVEQVEQVISSFQAWLLKNGVCDAEAGVVLHPKTEEVIPGLGVREGNQPGSLTVVVDPAAKALYRNYARQVVAEALAAEYGEAVRDVAA